MDRERLQGFLNSLGPLSFIGFIFLQALQVIAAPVPGEVTGVLGGYLYGSFLGIILSTMGLTLGSWLAFLSLKDLRTGPSSTNSSARKPSINMTISSITRAPSSFLSCF